MGLHLSDDMKVNSGSKMFDSGALADFDVVGGSCLILFFTEGGAPIFLDNQPENHDSLS